MTKIKPVSNQRLMYLDLLRVAITFLMAGGGTNIPELITITKTMSEIS